MKLFLKMIWLIIKNGIYALFMLSFADGLGKWLHLSRLEALALLIIWALFVKYDCKNLEA